jgi:hypothetical protein
MSLIWLWKCVENEKGRVGLTAERPGLSGVLSEKKEWDVSGRITSCTEPMGGTKGKGAMGECVGAVRLAILICWNFVPYYRPCPHFD